MSSMKASSTTGLRSAGISIETISVVSPGRM